MPVASPPVRTRHFSIHGVVALTVRTATASAGLAHVDRQFAPFRVPALDRPADITVDLVEPHDPRVAVGKTGANTVAADAVSWTSRRRLGRWRVHVTGLDRPPVSVAIAGNRFSHRYLVFHVLEPLIDYHLGLRGMTLVHASAVGTGESALAFSSPSGVGKTSLALLLLGMGVSHFLGDEFIIVGRDGSVRSFPLPLSLFHRNLVSTPSLKRRLSTRARAALTMNRALAVVTRALVRPRLPVAVSEIFPLVTIPGTVRLGAFCCLEPTTGAALAVRQSGSVTPIIDRLLATNHLEFRHFRQALHACTDAHASSLVTHHDARVRDVLASALTAIPCFEVEVPARQRLESTRSDAAIRQVLHRALTWAS